MAILTPADFADYAGAPEPVPAAITSFTTGASQAAPTGVLGGGDRPYTAWYRVWERTTMDDFKLEMYVLPFLVLLVAFHVWGTQRNRNKARSWMKAHAPVLTQEFVQVGYTRPEAEQDPTNSDAMLKQKKADEYQTYATGRQNIGCVDFKLSLAKAYNPVLRLGEYVLPLFFESMPPPVERMEATLYAFDGQETKFAPSYGQGDAKKVTNSTFDGFVFAIVHKDVMKRMRDERYDLSLTSTRDHTKLPVWTTVMSESAEVTDMLLTPELIKAVNDAGDNFEALVVTDQPINAPRT
jgi:hypothetical protein